jgi:hypothetical protein
MTYFSESQQFWYTNTGPEYDKVTEQMKLSRINAVNMAGILRLIYSYPNARACKAK